MICVVEVKLNLRILRLYNTEDIPKTTSKFYEYFKHLINSVENSFWITTNDSFCVPIDWYPDSESEPQEELDEFYSSIIDQKNNYMLVDNRFMKKYGVYVRDDWNELMCFYGDLSCFQKLVQFLDATHGALVDMILDKEVSKGLKFEFLLHNWDAMYWELITEKDVYCEQLSVSIQGNKGIMIEEIIKSQ